MKRVRELVLLVLACGFVAGAQAEVHAVLIGVTGYPSLPESLRLHGPRNDVQNLRRVLLGRGVEESRIRVLADGVPGAGTPDRATILQSLDALLTQVRAGDVALLYYAGHGSRQPAADGGMEPILLPLDVGRWEGGAGTVMRAITGADLRGRIDALVARGVFVWAVFDACHSAALVRGRPDADQAVARRVDPAVLGIDAGAVPTTRGASATLPTMLAARSGGAAAFFYAAQPDELTPELPLPPGSSERQAYGLFSFVLSKALERGQSMSYRQLAQYVLAEYGALRTATSTPAFSGEGLDAVVLGLHQAPQRQWPLRVDGSGFGVAAGRLAGIAPGAIFAAVPGPLARDAERFGLLQASAVEVSRSALVPVSQSAQAPVDPESLRARAGTYLRLVSSPPEFALRVGSEVAACPPSCALRDAIRQLQAVPAPGIDLQWVDASEAPDVVLRVRQHRLTYGSATDLDAIAADDGPGLDLRIGGQERSAADVGSQLVRDLPAIARVRNLLALDARLGDGGAASSLRVSLRRGGERLLPEQVATLCDGNELALEVENNGVQPVDLTVLYADAAFGLTALFPGAQGEVNRIAPGERRVIDRIRIEAPPAGIERLLLIHAHAEARSERSDYSFLAQPALTRHRGSASEDFDAFADAAFADYRRRGAARPASPGPGVAMQAFTFRVQPSVSGDAGHGAAATPWSPR